MVTSPRDRNEGLAAKAWWKKRDTQPPDLISSEMLAEYGRYAFLGPDAYQGRIEQEMSGWEVVGPLVLAMIAPDGRARVLNELRRHGADGEWQRVGGWKVVKEYDGVDYGPDAIDIVEGGFRALRDMGVTNVAPHIARGEQQLWQQLIGGPPPNDFAGPPVFDSVFGHSKEFYFDQVVAASARLITRLPEIVGKPPEGLRDAAMSVWNFALLLYRGVSRVHVDIRFEPSTVRAAVACASSSDHNLFVDGLARQILDGDPFFRESPWAAIGAARFVEEYLQPHAVGAMGYDRLLDAGLRGLLDHGLVDYDVPLDVLTARQRDRLSKIGAR